MNELRNQILFWLTIHKKLTYRALLAMMNHYIDMDNYQDQIRVSEILFALIQEGVVRTYSDRRILNPLGYPTLTFSLRHR